MREATPVEYSKVTTTPHATKRQMDTKRTTTVHWSFCGTPIAEKTVIYSRGKIVSTSFMVNPEYLRDNA